MSSWTRYVALARQASIDTPATSGFKYIHVDSCDLHLEKEIIYDEDNISYIEYSSALEGLRTVKGGIEQRLNPSMIGELLNSFFGGATTTQIESSTAYLHSFTPSNNVIPYTVIVAADGIAERFIGCGVGKIEFIFEAGEAPTMRSELLGRDMDITTPSIPSYPSVRNWLPTETSLTLGGEAVFIKKLELSLENGLSDDEFVVGSNVLQRLSPRKYSVDIKLSARFLTSSRLEEFLSGSETSMRINLTGPEIPGAEGHSYQLIIEMPRVVYDSHTAEIDARELLVEEIEMRALRSLSEPSISISLKNTDPGY
ncbi:MAG: phage tail tube protein [Nitrososphaerota archaeon]